MLLRLLFGFLLCLSQLHASAQCVDFIDYDQTTNTYLGCTDEPVDVAVVAVFADSSQSDQISRYYLRATDSFDPAEPDALAIYTTSTIAPPADFVPGQTYYLFLTAGIDDGTGNPDPTDPCFAQFDESIQLSWVGGAPLTVELDGDPLLDCGETGTIDLLISGGTPPYVYFWTDGQSTSNISISAPGYYAVTVTDANGCNAFAEVFTAVDIDPLTVDSTVDITCDQATGQVFGSYDSDAQLLGINAFNPGNGTFSFPTDSTFVYTTTTPEPDGFFRVQMGDAAGQACGDSLYANYSVQQLSTGCAFINGNVFRNNDSDCQQNSNEVGLAQRLVKLTGSIERYTLSDANGYYSLLAPPGESVEVEIVSQHLLYENCNTPLTLIAPPVGQTLTQNLGQQTLADCPLLTVAITTPLVRRCFPNSLYLDYCNDGTVSADDVYVLLDLDPLYELNLDSLPNVSLDPDGRYRIELGNLAEGACGSLYLPATVSCDAVLGQTLCLEAEILPEFDCLPTDPNYSGARVEVTGSCDNGVNRFAITNTGTAAMPSELDFIVIEDGVVLMQAPFELPAGESVDLAYPGMGQTYRVEAEQVPNFPTPSMPSATVEGCTAGTDSTSMGFVLQFSLDDLYPGTDIECNEVIGSYDPNDKRAFPRGYAAAHYIDNATPLEYHIRFQNTGTDTAFTVVVEDALDPRLDISTFRPLAASHPYQVAFGLNDTVRFVFNDILLPDSFVNEPLSHGFIRFAIELEADLPLETVVTNRAGIYFDFNAPIITNEVFHTVGREFLVVSTPSVVLPRLAVSTYPNPATDTWYLQLDGLPDVRELELTLVDAWGRVVRKTALVTNPAAVPVSGLTEGVYFYQLRRGGVVLATGKLMRL